MAAASSAATAGCPTISRWPRRPCSPAGRRHSTGAPCWTRSAASTTHFFLYCEDTDLGLRARWAGWKCLYVPDAVVEHHYSHSAGRASPLKAYYVERNRLFVLAKNFPARMLLAAPFVDLGALPLALPGTFCKGEGSAARFRAEGHAGPRMLWYVVRAHAALLRQRSAACGGSAARSAPAPASRRRSSGASLRSHSISARRVAAL